MNSSGEIVGLGGSVARYEDKIAREEELNKIKQEITEVKKEVVALLKPIENDIQNIKSNFEMDKPLTKDEMIKFFEKFLNEFSHAVENIENPQTKNVFLELIKKTLKKLEEW